LTWKKAITITVVGVALALPQVAMGQATAPSALLDQYRAARTSWFTAVATAARQLFGILALIEFAWSGAVLLLEKGDLHSWTAGMVRKIMWIGAFFTLLIYGPTWIPAIIDSFEILGQRAAGTGPLSPSGILMRGISIAGALLKSAGHSGILGNFGTALVTVLAAILTVLGFVAITVQFVVAMIESYIVVSAGMIFLGFGGSRWTAPYVERQIGYAVSTGVKIMLLYMLIGLGMTLSDTWITDAQNVMTTAEPVNAALEIMGGSLIFTAICWQIPKLLAAVIGGAPALTGGDLVSTTAAIGYGAAMAGTAAVAGVGAFAGAIKASSAVAVSQAAKMMGIGAPGAAGGPASTGTAASVNSPPKPAASPAPAPGTQSKAGGSQPAPPVQQQRSAEAKTSTSDTTRVQPKPRLGRVGIPPDNAPHTPPPPMNLDRHED
jgi:type IV secretion system protein TrbL